MRDLLGVPFVWGGRDVAADGGLDCWGLVRAVRPEIPEYTAVDLRDAARIMRAEERLWRRATHPRVGDIALMGRILMTHAGIVVADGMILHTTRQTGAIVQRIALLRQPGFYPSMRFYRWPG